MSIPKVLIQTSRDPLPEYVTEMILNRISPNWQYRHFNHEQREQWMIDNPHPDFPNVMEVYHSFKSGAHQADLFRYYYLYLKGGMYLDSDAMLDQDPDEVCKDAGFVGVADNLGNSFNGFLASIPKHQVIRAALDDVYKIKPEHLESRYNILCHHLNRFICASDTTDMIILREDRAGGDCWQSYDKHDRSVVSHYPNTKIIPKT
jgi:mannosyltransferase OCH1-like enzyme